MKRHDRRGPRTRSVLLATGLLVLGITSFGIAASGDTLREGQRNGTTTRETEIVSNIRATTDRKGGYATRQSNLSSSGGGAVYGCRSRTGTSDSNPPQNPCVRANNLETGLAFEFFATKGSQVGLISVGAGGDDKRPFTTNATGVATGLNADRVDGAGLEQIQADAAARASAARTRYVLVNEQGTIEEQSGGFTVVSRPGINGQPPSNPNIYIDAGTTLVGSGLSATIAIQNRIDRTGDGTADPAFNGDASVGRCNTPAINCVPTGTNTDNTLVVRALANNADAGSQTRRVYVEVTP